MPKYRANDLHARANLSTPAEAQGVASTQRALENATGKLSDKFVVPPFSIFDTRQAYWQNRKKAYLSFGIQSELGRGQGITYSPDEVNLHPTLEHYRDENAPESSSRHKRLGKTYDLPWNITDQLERENQAAGRGRLEPPSRVGKQLGETFNSGGPGTLTQTFKQANNPGSANDTRPGRDGGKYKGGHAWLSSNGAAPRSYHTQEWVKDKELAGLSQGQTGTSIFDPVICELAYRWFCPPTGVVLDPFAGGSVRGIVASIWGRGYVGIDLRPEQVEANIKQREQIRPEEKRLTWLCGDARDVDQLVGNARFDFLFTCPPYYNLEQYSYLDGDLSNAPDYDGFLESYERIIANSLLHLRTDRFACFVVGNFRGSDSRMVDFVGDTIRAFESAGADFYNEIILVNVAGSLPIRVRNQFRASRKIGKTHQQVLVFVKGDARRAAEVCIGT